MATALYDNRILSDWRGFNAASIGKCVGLKQDQISRKSQSPLWYKLDVDSYISTNRPSVPHSRGGCIKPITDKHFHNFVKIPSGSFQETNLRGYVAQDVLKLIF